MLEVPVGVNSASPKWNSRQPKLSHLSTVNIRPSIDAGPILRIGPNCILGGSCQMATMKGMHVVIGLTLGASGSAILHFG